MAPDPYNPQSRNKYSYCFNNPLKYYDPSGNWPKFLDDAVSWVKDKVEVVVEAASEFVSENIDTIQTALDVVGMIPVVGEAFDAVNGAIYTARGDAVNAALSFAACVPVAGNVATGAKLVGKAVDKVHDVVKVVDKIHDIARASDTYSVYRSIDKATNAVEYVGITKNFERRAAEHLRISGRSIEPISGLTGLSKTEARGVEQVLINQYGLSGQGSLGNIINSIARSNPIYDAAVQRGMELLKLYGY